MAKVVKRTFSLTEEQAKFIDAKVEAGKFASGSEVVRAGLRGMAEDDAIIEEWIKREVLPAIEEHEAHPERARPADEVFEEILAEMREKTKSRKRA
jgi:antitoxin ParD1/3/4